MGENMKSHTFGKWGGNPEIGYYFRGLFPKSGQSSFKLPIATENARDLK